MIVEIGSIPTLYAVSLDCTSLLEEEYKDHVDSQYGFTLGWYKEFDS